MDSALSACQPAYQPDADESNLLTNASQDVCKSVRSVSPYYLRRVNSLKRCSALTTLVFWQPGEEREALGRCVAGLQLTAERAKPPGAPHERRAWLLDFHRRGAAPGSAAMSASTSAPRLEDSCLNEGDMVIISVEGDLPWLTHWLTTTQNGYCRAREMCLKLPATGVLSQDVGLFIALPFVCSKKSAASSAGFDITACDKKY